MPVDKIIIGKKYKFDNKLFSLERSNCYGINEADKRFLFNSKVLEFTFFSYVLDGNEYFTYPESTKKIIFYCKGMIEKNTVASASFGVSVWRAESDFLNYLTLLKNVVQEEMDV